MKIQTTKDILQNGFTCLVYGEAGVGKTFDIQKLPNPIVISTEGGLLSLQGLDIPFVEVNSWTEFLETLKEILTNEAYKNNFICIDSLTVLSEYCYKHFLSINPDDSRGAYGKLGDSFVSLVEKLQKLNRNIYLIAQVHRNEDAGVKSSPLFKGAYSVSRIPHILDFIFVKRLVMDNNQKLQRVIQVISNNQFEVKSRIPLKKEYYKDISEIYNELFNCNTDNKKDEPRKN